MYNPIHFADDPGKTRPLCGARKGRVQAAAAYADGSYSIYSHCASCIRVLGLRKNADAAAAVERTPEEIIARSDELFN